MARKDEYEPDDLDAAWEAEAAEVMAEPDPPDEIADAARETFADMKPYMGLDYIGPDDRQAKRLTAYTMLLLGMKRLAAKCSGVKEWPTVAAPSRGPKHRWLNAWHNIVIHPLAGVCWLLGFERWGDWLHGE